MDLEKLEKYREKKGLWKTDPGTQHGLFFVPSNKYGEFLKVLCAPMESEWQHVSVSHPRRVPTWSEMCSVKDLFWSEEETVVQFHPKKSEYINNVATCLHMWKKKDVEYELPPSILVGV